MKWKLLLTSALVGCGAQGEPSPTPETPTPPIDPALYEPGSWDNATIYFVITDRFHDGDPSNNQSYGRALDGEDEVGTFHGGDLAGLRQKLEEGYFTRLGVSALWITAPYEQIHGWVPGGTGQDFRHYAYHGYYALDFTRMDANQGSEADLAALVDTAHSLGIRVILDVVMNHPGYANIVDLETYGVDVLLSGYASATPQDYYPYINFDSPAFATWWGVDWIRAGLGGGYETGSSTDPYTQSVGYLPDFKTEDADVGIGLPPFMAMKPDTAAVDVPSFAVRDYLVDWLSQWVYEYGIDGFRCDTAKHVEPASWQALKIASNDALASWRAAHPEEALPDGLYADPSAPFWMVGEVFPHGVVKDGYFESGFDALINFDFAQAAGAALSDVTIMDSVYQSYADKLNPDPTFNVLSYISSHDTSLFLTRYAADDPEKQKLGGTLLLLAPGAVQIFYGDENARPFGPTASDPMQGTRSDYLWGTQPDVLRHWRRVGQFRRLHEAVGAGTHTRISSSPYTFRRALGEDVVYVVLAAPGEVEVDVSADFSDGALLTDAYTGATATVASGVVRFTAAPEGLLLIERSE